jgi:hypothetical protein
MLQAHQQRIVDEKNALDIKIKALENFMENNPFYLTMDEHEALLLHEQLEFMTGYSATLGKRIELFTK